MANPPSTTLSKTGTTRSGFCNTGAHDLCPGRIESGIGVMTMREGKTIRIVKPGLWVCPCNCGCQTRERCIKCKHEPAPPLLRFQPEEFDHDKWQCADRTACKARSEQRLASNPALQRMAEVRRSKMSETATETTPKAPKAPKVGACKCCGGTTKGGMFLPGHDARYVSEQVAFIMQGSKAEADVREDFGTLSDALGKKFERSLDLAKEAKAKKEAAAKAAEEKKIAAEDEKKAKAAAAKAEKAKAAAEKAETPESSGDA